MSATSRAGARPSRSFRRTALGLSPRRTDYLGALDGLRAVAVVAVVAYHLGHLDGGFLGVDVFFVLSGFLITRLLLAERERSGGVDLRAFWRRRFRRLLPPLLVVLAAVAVFARLWLPNWRWADIRVDAFAALAYVANWRFVQSGQSYFGQGAEQSPLRHTWSLGVEEQFYVVWPLLVLLAMHLAPRAVRGLVLVGSAVVVVVSASWMAVAAGGSLDLNRIYYGTDTRVFAMCAGALLATFWDPWREWVGSHDLGARMERRVVVAANVALGGLVVLFVVGSDAEASFYRWGFQSAALLAVVAVAGLAVGKGRVAGALSGGIARWVGRRSYGIYLWSWPVQIFARIRFSEHLGWGLDLVIVALAVGLAALSFRFVEQPILAGRYKHASRSGPARRPSGVLGTLRPVSAVAAVVALLMVTTSGASSTPTVFAVSDDEARDAALEDDGFGSAASDPGAVTGESGASPLPADVLDEAATNEAVRNGSGLDLGNGGVSWPDDALDPGPEPPFDPHGPLLVTSADGDPTAVHGRPLRVLLMGDSAAWTLGWKVEDGLDPRVLLSTRAIIGCGMMPIDSSWGSDSFPMEPYGELCVDQPLAEDKGFASDPDVLLLWFGAWEVYDHVWEGEDLPLGSARYEEVLEGRIQQRIDRSRELGVPVVISVVPCMTEVPFGRYGEAREDAERVQWVNQRIVDVALRNPGWVRLIDPNPQLCDDDGQPRERNGEGEVLRPDGVHFERSTALWLWNSWMVGALGSALAPAS